MLSKELICIRLLEMLMENDDIQKNPWPWYHLMYDLLNEDMTLTEGKN